MTAPADDDRPRPHVLVGAYALGPGDEPEAGAGWAFAVAAAARHEVWAVTRRRFRPAVTQALAADPRLAAHLHVTYVDAPAAVLALKRLPGGVYWYYAWWQALLARTARRLHAQVGFDVLHHVTWANDWMPCGLARVEGVPLVWGPVGGASRTPYRRLRRWLGVRGVVVERLRDTVVALARRRWGDAAARRASLVVAQNPEVAERFAGARRVVVEPNAVVDPEVEPAPAPAGTTPGEPAVPARTAVHVARLIPWKGTALALDALARPEARGWRLDVYGDGPLRRALEARARRLGLTGRVRFHGRRPRSEVLAATARADALLFPSMHDQAGWVAAEASTLGTPVVCLPLGGPPLLAQPAAFVAALEGDVVGNLARALVAAGEAGGTRHGRWSAARLPGLLAGWYAAAAADAAALAAPTAPAVPAQGPAADA
ncbi:phosphohistidine phosphatase [Xylanimonas oleitrophica]|uniref:Phosphohistidine phosphatase n=1 Tax=Xylanimonas oleitrophica TaxID=2607479 RepID=A0A2W5WRX5_9MICO|nr:glycosyltransferase [Xylanimonas oleitrophica]PZR54259.1 phosphohistidine phosphatase [Xylanimonas oleitrophica]